MYEALSTGQMLHTCEEVIAVVVMGHPVFVPRVHQETLAPR